MTVTGPAGAAAQARLRQDSSEPGRCTRSAEGSWVTVLRFSSKGKSRTPFVDLRSVDSPICSQVPGKSVSEVSHMLAAGDHLRTSTGAPRRACSSSMRDGLSVHARLGASPSAGASPALCTRAAGGSERVLLCAAGRLGDLARELGHLQAHRRAWTAPAELDPQDGGVPDRRQPCDSSCAAILHRAGGREARVRRPLVPRFGPSRAA